MALGSVNVVKLLLEMLKDMDCIDLQIYLNFVENYIISGKRLNVLLNKWE